MKIYEYDLNHKLIHIYNSHKECVDVHYSYRKYKKTITFLSREKFNIRYNISKVNGNYLFNQKVDKNTFRKIKNITESVYYSKRIKDKINPIEIYNLEGDLLMEVRNINVLSLLTNIPPQTVKNQLNSDKYNLKKEFIIKYKK